MDEPIKKAGQYPNVAIMAGIMTLDEAINHAREIAAKGGECAKDHEQLAEWLEELRGIVRCGDCNYTRLFGTPERAANTVLALQVCPMSKDECEECPAYDVCFEYFKDGRTVYEMAEWLRGDA